MVAQMVKNLPAMLETQVPSLGWEDPLEKGMATHSSILAWRIPQRSLVGYSPWSWKESDMTEATNMHYLEVCCIISKNLGFSSDLLGEGNGNPLQYSCLENPMDGGAWWAAVHGVAEGQI